MNPVGLIGLGRIGSRLAANLLASGMQVVGCDIVAKPQFVAAGGTFATTPREVAERAEIILHSLVGAAALNAVLEGPNGLLANIKPHHVIADLSTYLLEQKTAARDRVTARGAVFLDCQITGTPEMLADGRGVIFASGDEKAAARCAPVFLAAVPKQYFLGPFGAATKLKTANNLLVGLNAAATAEAMALAVSAGIDPKIAIEIMGAGAGQSQMFTLRAPLMAERRYPNTSSTLNSFTVYLDLIDAALRASSLDMPLARSVVDLYRRAIAAGMGEQEMSCIYELIFPQASKP